MAPFAAGQEILMWILYFVLKILSLLLVILVATWLRRCRLRLKCDGTRVETRFCLSAKRTSPFKSAGASVQSTTGSRVVRISGSNGSNAGYTMFRGSVTRIGYPLHSPVSPSLPLPCVTVCHHVSTWLYIHTWPETLLPEFSVFLLATTLKLNFHTCILILWLP